MPFITSHLIDVYRRSRLRRSLKRTPLKHWGFSTVAILILAGAITYLFLVSAPRTFPHGAVVTVQEGQTLGEVAELLQAEGIVRSSFVLRNVAIAMGGERGVRAGDYFFLGHKNVFEVAYMLSFGDFGLEPIRVTLPEGSSVADMAEILENRLTRFDAEQFMRLAEDKEGYLFPDTYFFLPNVSERTVISVLESTFEEKIAELMPQIEAFGQPLEDVITMASIIERESATAESRRIISGILWKRIEIDMPLQVDVTFDYINGKNSFDLTLEDLDIDNPYNTYRYLGLPPGPIANPSLDSIEAAISPRPSDYLFFLADHSGTVHYSETFDEHRYKKSLYLN